MRSTIVCLALLAGATCAGSVSAQTAPSGDAASRPAAETAPRQKETPQDARPELRLDEQRVVELALQDQPTVQAAREALNAAEAAHTAATVQRLPDVTLTARYTRLSSIPARYRSFDGFTFPQLLDNLGARAELVVPLSDAFLGLAAAARAAGREAEARSLEVTTTRAQVAYQARLAFLQFWKASVDLDNARELVRASQLQVDDQQNRERAGTVARNDVLTFEVALDAAVMSALAREADLASAEAMLRTFFPAQADKRLVVNDMADAPAPVVPERAASVPSIASLEARARAADARADSASWGRLPSLGLFAAGDISAPSPRVFVMDRLVAVPSWQVGVQLQWSISQATAGTARTASARAEHAGLVAKVQEARRTFDGERAAATKVVALAHDRVQRAKQRVQRARALAEARRGELEAGTALPLNVVIAETDWLRAKNEHVDAFVEQAVARARLDFVDGRVQATP